MKENEIEEIIQNSLASLSLILTSCNLSSPETVWFITDCIASNNYQNNFTTLDLSDTHLNLKCLEMLITMTMSFTKLQNLFIRGNQLPKEAGNVIARLLQAPGGLKVLDISNNELGDIGIAAIFNVFNMDMSDYKRNENTAIFSLQSMNISNNSFGDMAILALCRGLTQLVRYAASLNKSVALKVLHLQNNRVGDKAALCIAQLVNFRSTFSRHSSISHHESTQSSSTPASAVKSHHLFHLDLYELDLSDTLLTDKGMISLIANIQDGSYTSLKKLHVRHCHPTSHFISSIIDILKNPERISLEILDITFSLTYCEKIIGKVCDTNGTPLVDDGPDGLWKRNDCYILCQSLQQLVDLVQKLNESLTLRKLRLGDDLLKTMYKYIGIIHEAPNQSFAFETLFNTIKKMNEIHDFLDLPHITDIFLWIEGKVYDNPLYLQYSHTTSHDMPRRDETVHPPKYSMDTLLQSDVFHVPVSPNKLPKPVAEENYGKVIRQNALLSLLPPRSKVSMEDQMNQFDDIRSEHVGAFNDLANEIVSITSPVPNYAKNREKTSTVNVSVEAEKVDSQGAKDKDLKDIQSLVQDAVKEYLGQIKDLSVGMKQSTRNEPEPLTSTNPSESQKFEVSNRGGVPASGRPPASHGVTFEELKSRADVPLGSRIPLDLSKYPLTSTTLSNYPTMSSILSQSNTSHQIREGSTSQQNGVLPPSNNSASSQHTSFPPPTMYYQPIGNEYETVEYPMAETGPHLHLAHDPSKLLHTEGMHWYAKTAPKTTHPFQDSEAPNGRRSVMDEATIQLNIQNLLKATTSLETRYQSYDHLLSTKFIDFEQRLERLELFMRSQMDQMDHTVKVVATTSSNYTQKRVPDGRFQLNGGEAKTNLDVDGLMARLDLLEKMVVSEREHSLSLTQSRLHQEQREMRNNQRHELLEALVVRKNGDEMDGNDPTEEDERGHDGFENDLDDVGDEDVGMDREEDVDWVIEDGDVKTDLEVFDTSFVKGRRIRESRKPPLPMEAFHNVSNVHAVVVNAPPLPIESNLNNDGVNGVSTGNTIQSEEHSNDRWTHNGSRHMAVETLSEGNKFWTTKSSKDHTVSTKSAPSKPSGIYFTVPDYHYESLIPKNAANEPNLAIQNRIGQPGNNGHFNTHSLSRRSNQSISIDSTLTGMQVNSVKTESTLPTTPMSRKKKSKIVSAGNFRYKSG